MKRYAIIFFLLGFFSCKRAVPDYPETIKPNILVLQTGTKFYEVPITSQLLSNATIGDFLIIAESSEIELRLAAKSYTHNQGAGNYFLACCDNQLLEKFVAGQYFVGVRDGAVNSTPKDKGVLTITNINLSGYLGAFTFIGQNAIGEEKEFTGKFRVVY
jgi:hypothetical protein